MIIYLIIGLLWTIWLEWFTTTDSLGLENKKWIMRERLFHISIWPISIGIFLYHLINGVDDND